MEYTERYEIHWRKHAEFSDGPQPLVTESGVETYERETVAWDELDAMHRDPDIAYAALFRQCSIQLGSCSKARPHA